MSTLLCIMLCNVSDFAFNGFLSSARSDAVHIAQETTENVRTRQTITVTTKSPRGKISKPFQRSKTNTIRHHRLLLIFTYQPVYGSSYPMLPSSETTNILYNK
ncbi:hypothetical protein T12_12203 [Trichinella patagoniensis]|uniref:Uncharacterized protein n=1 Tax=Trichinella patagoniensis TaxID=990121 RepID=A0A0V0Z7N9_9BILA|nr:hypothetical protein T12_12203 [Trichinella patagoniensis]